MIGWSRYVRCDRCYRQMIGIMSPEARETCHGCGGKALIGEMPSTYALVRRAKERLQAQGLPTRPPRHPHGPGAA